MTYNPLGRVPGRRVQEPHAKMGETEEGNMKIIKIVGAVLVAIGAIAILGSVLVDLVGYGVPGFGIQQIAGIAFGAIDAILGVILLAKK